MWRREAPVLPSLVMDVVVGFVHGDACALIGLCPHLGLEYLPSPHTKAPCGEVRGPGNAQAKQTNEPLYSTHLGLIEEGVVEREYELAHFVELLDGVGGHCLLRVVPCVRCVWFACFWEP